MADLGSRYLLTPGTEAFLHAAASCSLPVLLEGETGTGKSVLARLIHDRSARRVAKPLSVGCGTLPRDLLERELFGHRKGTFTGADQSMPGLVDAAEGGTLILNEVEAIPVDLQAKILDLADARAIRSLGSPEIRRVDVRLIATTNSDLRAAINQREFRQDLYFRLAIMRLVLPPLRKRTADIPRIAQMVLEHDWQQQMGERPLPKLDAGALTALQSHNWPGNMRELKAVLFRAALACQDDVIIERNIEAAIEDGEPFGPPSLDTEVPARAHRRYRAPEDPAEERRRIVEALRIERGHRERAARRLGMSRQTLWEKMREYKVGAEEVGS